jgi:hypothetical protein
VIGRRRGAILPGIVLAGIAMLASTLAAIGPVASAGAAGNVWPRRAMGGFSTPKGAGFWITYANGAVSPVGSAKNFGDSSSLGLVGPMQGGASTPKGDGYWLVGYDGGVFTHGAAHFYGSMGGHVLNQPIFSMSSTASGRGYWLVARDGGIFSFGDAHFHGSAGNMHLNQPITGITRSPSGRGYRMVATDGGIFSFGDTPFYGSLPGKGIHVSDVVGMAPTPTNKGYWIVRRDGSTYAFGDAHYYGNYTTFTCDPVTGIFSNPSAPGYRIVTQNGATIPFGTAPGGSAMTGSPKPCATQRACVPALKTAADYQTLLNTRGPLWDGGDGAAVVDLGNSRRLWLFGDTYSGPTDDKFVLPGYSFLRNSVAVEDGPCMEFRLGGIPTALDDYIPRPAAADWYWPLDGIVDQAKNVVLLSALRVTASDGAPGFRWKVVRTEIITLDLRSLAYRGATPLPAGAGLQWGSSMLDVGGTIYIYADNLGDQYVARTTMAHLTDGHWSYWNGTSWSTQASAARPMRFRGRNGEPDTSPGPAPTIEPYGTGYLASAKRCDVLCDDLTAWYSPTPSGPWRAVNAQQGRVGITGAALGLVVYGGHMVPSRGGWLNVWSVNRTNNSMAKYVYGPRVAATQNLPTAAFLAALPPLPLSTASAAGVAPRAVPSPAPTGPPTQAPTDLPTPNGWVNH